MSRRLKPGSLFALNVQAKAWTYLRSNGNGNGNSKSNSSDKDNGNSNGKSKNSCNDIIG